MKNTENILKAYLKKRSLIYERALGAEEMWNFMSKAPEILQNKVFNLINRDKIEEAVKIIEKFLQLEQGSLWKHIN